MNHLGMLGQSDFDAGTLLTHPLKEAGRVRLELKTSKSPARKNSPK